MSSPVSPIKQEEAEAVPARARAASLSAAPLAASVRDAAPPSARLLRLSASGTEMQLRAALRKMVPGSTVDRSDSGAGVDGVAGNVQATDSRGCNALHCALARPTTRAADALLEASIEEIVIQHRGRVKVRRVGRAHALLPLNNPARVPPCSGCVSRSKTCARVGIPATGTNTMHGPYCKSAILLWMR